MASASDDPIAIALRVAAAIDEASEDDRALGR